MKIEAAEFDGAYIEGRRRSSRKGSDAEILLASGWQNQQTACIESV
jgi:hypothetical protein